jgi:hypothetical protein
MTDEQRFAFADHRRHDPSVHSRAGQRGLDLAMVRADISESPEEYRRE